MQEDWMEFLEEIIQDLMNKVCKKYESVDDRASMLLHINESILSTVLGMCTPDDRDTLIKEILNSNSSILTQVKEVLTYNQS